MIHKYIYRYGSCSRSAQMERHNNFHIYTCTCVSSFVVSEILRSKSLCLSICAYLIQPLNFIYVFNPHYLCLPNTFFFFHYLWFLTSGVAGEDKRWGLVYTLYTPIHVSIFWGHASKGRQLYTPRSLLQKESYKRYEMSALLCIWVGSLKL